MTTVTGIVKGGQLIPEEQWRKFIASLTPNPDDLETNKERSKRAIARLLAEAVKKRLKEKNAVLFSGGVDSSLIAFIIRKLGKELKVPDEILNRHPFPGPGLAIRILGEVTDKRLSILREADFIFIDELKKSGYYSKTWQAFAALLPVKAVGVMGDARTYEYIISLRAVTSLDAMTADWAKLPNELLEKISNRIINEVRGVNRVLYDVSQKPPATIEYE